MGWVALVTATLGRKIFQLPENKAADLAETKSAVACVLGLYCQ